MRPAPVLGVLAAALVAAPAQAAVVAVTDSGLREPRTRTFAGQRVSFENLTGGSVTVDSRGRPSFADVALAAGGKGERRFMRAGRYRYEAAGRDGVIVVRSLPRRPRPRRDGRDGCGGREVHRYDVTVKGRKSVRETWRPEFRQEGDFSISYGYVVDYPDVRIGVTDACGGTRKIEVLAGRSRAAPGTGSLSGYRWSDAVRSADDGRPAPCAFVTAVTGLDAELSLEGFASPGGAVSLDSRLTVPQADVLAEILAARRDGVCDMDPGRSNARVFDGLPGYDASATPIFSEDFAVAGGKLQPPNVMLQGRFSAFRQRGRPPAVARRLARGRPVTVATTRTFDGASSQTTAHGTASISISLRPR